MKQKGITLVALSITIIVLLIIAGIIISSGRSVIRRAKLEELKTNMLLIEAKAKEYVENANFKLGIEFDKATDTDKENRIEHAKQELKGELIEDTNQYGTVIGNQSNEENKYFYQLNQTDLEQMGLSKVEGEGIYIIQYDIQNLKVEIYNTEGFKNENQMYYSLSEIESLNI